MKILIAEDNENSRVLLESLLDASGYEVESAENGKIALKYLQNSPPDLIISDILMPEMDGYALCREIKSNENYCTIPFIFYTATYTDPIDEKLAMELGAARFIVKPMEINLLLSEIKSVFAETETENLLQPEKLLKAKDELQDSYTAALSRKLDQKVRALQEEKIRLIKSEKKYRRLVEALREDYFFYTHDANGLFIYVSPSVNNVLGFTQEEFQQSFKQLLTDDEKNEAALKTISHTLKGVKQSSCEVEIHHKNGSIHRLELTEDPVMSKNGDILAVEGIAHDITKRIITEKQLAKAHETIQQSQKMEAIGTLAGGIAHDFNNLLSPIIGYTEITRMTLPDGSKEKQNLKQVLNAANRARDLSWQILTFSRQADTETKPILLQGIIREALKLLRATIPVTIEIREAISDCDPVSANATQMNQIVMNLCTNAYYAMRDHGGILAVSLKSIHISPENYIANLDLPTGKHVRLEISDTGVGIGKENLERIFEPYFTTKPVNEGTGLGLSVVHGIVRNYGGNITVYSEVGKGTSFHIYLPVIIQDEEIFESIENVRLENGTENILLVDDDEIIGGMVKEQLTRLGYQVTVLTSGIDALEIFRKNPEQTDIVITDMTMPKMTGAELAAALLEINPELPIILCTGFSELIDRDKAFDIGIKEFLMKPVSLYDISGAVRTVLDEKRS